MKEDISRTAGNEYNRIDKDIWLVLPRYEDVEPFVYLDVRKLAIMRDPKPRPRAEDVDDETIIDIVKKEQAEWKVLQKNKKR